MHHRKQLHVPALATLLALAACASGSDRQSAPVRVDELVTWIERVHIEAERSRDTIADTFERLNALAAGRFDKNPAPVLFARFVQSIDVAEQQSKRFREVVGPMLEAAQPVFTQWQRDLATIESERLRTRSEARFQLTKERYEAIRKEAVPAQDRFDGFVRSLRDQATFLSHDLNATALDDIQAEVKLAAETALALDRSLETTMAAARAYVQQSALPAAPAGGN
jgi:hypothetical protein